MNRLEQRLNKLETVTGVGAKSRTLTDSETEYTLFAHNHMRPEKEQIKPSDLNDSELLDEDGKFPWRTSGLASGVGIHLYCLREVNERKRKEREVQ